MKTIIDNAIDQAGYILSLQEDWDDRGGEGFSKETFDAVKSFLFSFSDQIFKTSRQIIDIPKIYPSANGSIDIDWETDSYGLLINIAKGGKKATYYGDDKAGQMTEGIFDPGKFNINLLPRPLSL